MGSIADTLNQLRAARSIVLQDPSPYPQVIAGIVQVISSTAQLEARQWGADFLAESFASQAVPPEMKQQMSLLVLDTLEGWLGRQKQFGEEEDVNVVKSAAQCAASVYPYVFRHTINTSDSVVWEKMTRIKSLILGRMDRDSPGVRICCIKFATCVVYTQTPGMISDPRRPEQNDISLALVPRDHTVIQQSLLEPQASGLLDRLLSVLQDDADNALIVTATLNALALLVQKRPSIMTKIMPAVLNFDPLRLANGPMTGKDKVSIRSMTRTTIAFLVNTYRFTRNIPSASRIQQHVERLKHSLQEAFSESRQLKRQAPDEPVDGLDVSKRQRLDQAMTNGTTNLQQHTTYAPLPPGPVSLAQVFTLTSDPRATTFPAEQLNVEVVTALVPAIIQALTQEQIQDAVSAVRTRLQGLRDSAPAPALSSAKPVTSDDDDDDYDPSIGFSGESEQIIAALDQMPPESAANDVAIGPFSLPPPDPLTEQEREEYSKTALTRVFETLSELDQEARLRDLDKDAKAKSKPVESAKGFNRLAANSSNGRDREGWITLVTRIATRTSLDLLVSGDTKHSNVIAQVKSNRSFDLANGIRRTLMNYITENFRARIDVAILWLNEEWYTESVAQQNAVESQRLSPSDMDDNLLPTYYYWTTRLFDAMSTYLDIRDGKILIRFVSEVPAINRTMLQTLKKIADDPDRVQMTINALLYLIMFRPPVREMAIDTVEQMWRENSDAKGPAAKILSKHRSGVLAMEKKENQEAVPTAAAGIKQET